MLQLVIYKVERLECNKEFLFQLFTLQASCMQAILLPLCLRNAQVNRFHNLFNKLLRR